MCPLRRVDGSQAGPRAVGLLIPPGRQTFVILRPRSLPCDLLLLESPGVPAFLSVARLAAPGLAQKVYRALEQNSRIETQTHAEGPGYWLQIRIGEFALVVCTRKPGQPYEPWVFPDSCSAQAVGKGLTFILNPPGDVEQEIYFNVRQFTS